MRHERAREARGSDWLRSLLAANNPYPRGEEAVFTGPKGARASELRLLPPPPPPRSFMLTQFQIMSHNLGSVHFVTVT